ncbi:TIGR02444 family protein [Vibrio breoganii]|uniref:TIGR02444 family protein n=1 Tax=Vibrio breoganii TaxID=553239 RepID=UPI0002F31899|nr:TIGR02444 family protein [Vibrio breoganii]OED94852.1 TIGR02444 family protein [Vibrio breoganii ZF-29]OEF83544.1 TIGR02444 family protein [Vibrio breoganii 1C10]PML53097.1 TIGR02444 family protein [Vibrio breoganii]PMO80717.1 TIGR02444 family protein [Vibrio breoganii]
MNNNTPNDHLTIESLWQFSLQYYSMREIKEACLNLQNHFHGNVNLLLALKWLDEHGLTFPTSQWPQVIQSLGRTEALLLHFRELRRKSKQHLPESLYRDSLQFELQLERQQQADIIDIIHRIELSQVEAPHLADDYCHQLGAEHLAVIFNKQRP